MLFGDEWVSEIFVSWGMTLQTLGMFLHTQTESVLIKTAWTGWNTLFHACVCVCGGECFCSDLKIHINSEENKNSSLVTLDLTGQIQLTSTQSNPHVSAPNTRLANGCMWRKSSEHMLVFRSEVLCFSPSWICSAWFCLDCYPKRWN